MIRRPIAIAALMCCSCAWAGAGSERGLQRAAAKQYLPAEIGPRMKDGPVKEKLQVRIWAAEDFQRVTLDWQVRLHRQIERVNEVLRAALGVELEVAQVKTWPESKGAASLQAALFDLQAVDPGENVDLVIGLITPLPLITPALHELGRATLFGKHMVMRGADDTEEAAAFDRAFGKLPAEEREHLYVARQRHREELLMLHELAHLWGALHVSVPTAIMQPSYDDRASGFSPVDIDMMKIGLETRHGNDKSAMVSYLEKTKFEYFVGNERVRMLALLTGDPSLLARASDADVVERTEEGAGAPSQRDAPPPDPLRDARTLAQSGEDAAAWRLLQPLLRERPDDADVVNLACGTAARLGTSSTAEALCRRAMEKVPQDASPALYLGYVLLERKADATAAIAESEKRLTATSAGAHPEAWGFLARLYQRTLSLTQAEDAAAKAAGTDDAVSIPKWVQQIRDDYGLKRGVLPAEREAEYLRARTEVTELIQKRRYREAEKAAEALSNSFPGLPGPDSTLCWMFVSNRSHQKAIGPCQRAIEAEPKSAQLRVLIGYAAFGVRKPALAIQHLERALQLDPDKKDVWSLLAAAYQAARKRDELQHLRALYLKRFGSPLR